MLNQTYTRLLGWFKQEGSPVPLTWFRGMVAAFCLVKILVIRNSLIDIYGQYGFVQWAITRANLYDGLPHIGDLTLWLAGLGLTADQSVHLILSVYLLALLGLLVGWKTRLMAVAAWFINFLLIHAGGGLVYGMDTFTHIALFYCIVMPVGDYLSLDTYLLKRQPRPSIAAGMTRRMLQLHLCIVYMSSGLEKASGSQWWNGEAIWRSLMLPVFQQFDMSWLSEATWLAVAVGWLVLATEIGYGVLIWWQKTRVIWLGLTIGMHLFIGLFLGMWLFASIMIILNLGAFGYEALCELYEKLSLGSSRIALHGPRTPHLWSDYRPS